MKLRTFKRHLIVGCKNLVRSGWMTFASASAVMVMLLVVGIFLLFVLNANHIASTLEDNVEMRAHIALNASEEEQEELERTIEEMETVESVNFVSRDEGLEDLIASTGESGQAFESLREENPLPDAFQVFATNPQLTEQVAGSIDELESIRSVNYGEEAVGSLFAITNVGRMIGVILAVSLMFTAMFLISNTIKLTIVARSKEIQIMKLVGATNAFVRWPFFVEGASLGLIGSFVPIGLVVGGYSYLYTQYGATLSSSFYSILPPFPLVWQVGMLLLAIGLFVGIWGSVMSVRKFLKA
ncbi:permease-like cell division protein FtsX [Shouchella shacheensis]|uniref:permease-like cell division protein FtsX n=1 Tax=Shouchella shacheensis TaxID=1649580 RepID=UPI00073FC04B|nr:permease-like cell division protein FtsX [Shouchella shacheensis]